MSTLLYLDFHFELGDGEIGVRSDLDGKEKEKQGRNERSRAAGDKRYHEHRG